MQAAHKERLATLEADRARQVSELEDAGRHALAGAVDEAVTTAASAHEKELASVRAEHARALADAVKAAESTGESALAAARKAGEEALGAAQKAAEASKADALEHAANERVKELAQKDAAWTSRKKDLDGEIMNLTMELEQTREKLEVVEERVRDLDAQLGKRQADLAAAEEKIGEQEARAATLSADLDARSEELGKRTEELGVRPKICWPPRRSPASSASSSAIGRAELAAARAESAKLSDDLANETARLDKARRKWGDDRASLDRAKEALSAAISKIEEAEARPLD